MGVNAGADRLGPVIRELDRAGHGPDGLDVLLGVAVQPADKKFLNYT